MYGNDVYLLEGPTCDFTLNVNAENFSTEPTQASLAWSDVRQIASSTPESSEYVVAGTTTVGLSIKDIFKDWLTVESKSYMLSSRISKSDGLFVSATGMDSGYEIIVCAPCHPDPTVFPSITVTYEEDEDLESGFYRIQSGYYNQTARYLTATASGNLLYDLDINNSNQLWYVEKSTDEMMSDTYVGDYLIYSVGQKKYMSFSLLDNTVGWYEQIERPAQTLSDCALKIVDQSNGYKRIVNQSSKKQLAALNYGKENYTPIVQEVMKGLDNQRWKFEKVESFIDSDGPSTYQLVVGEKVHLAYNAVDVNATFSISCTPPDSVISYRKSGDGLTTKYITVEAIGEGKATLTISMPTNGTQTGGQGIKPISWDFIVGAQTISLSIPKITMDIGDISPVVVNTTPKNASVTWISSDKTVASVDENGDVTARSIGTAIISATLPNKATVSCVVEVSNRYVEIMSTLTREEFYYLAYPPNIYPYPLLNNFPQSPTVSTLSYEKKLLSIELSRKYKSQPLNDSTIESFRDELNSTLGTNFSYLETKYIYAEYDMATNNDILLPNGARGGYYTPESIKSMNDSYLSALNTLATLVAFKVVCELNPFNPDGSIRFQADKYSKYYDQDLKPIYPGTNGDINKNGFVDGKSYNFTLQEGDTFDRYGRTSGRFAAPAGTPYAMRSLEPGTDLKGEYHLYRVERSFDAQVGYTAPWFYEPGGGIQYYFENTIQYYLDNGYISIVE